MRRIFSTVLGPHEPALTVGSLAISATVRPPIRPSPVTTPSAPRPSSCQLASSASSANESASSRRATRSRTGSLPCSRAFSRWRSGPPARARSVAPGRALTTDRSSRRQDTHATGPSPPLSAGPAVPLTPPPAREAAFVASLQTRFDDLEVRARAEQRPAVTHDGQQREGDDPAGPEGPVRARGDPRAGADRRKRRRAAGLLREAPAQLALALGERACDGRRADREIDFQLVEIGARHRTIGAADAILELLRGEPPGERVLAQLLDRLLAIGVGYAQLREVTHTKKLPASSW